MQTVERDWSGVINRYSTQYDFVGNVLTSHQSLASSEGATPDITHTSFTYDPRGRLLSECATLNNAPAIETTYTYNELGQLVGKSRAGEAGVVACGSYSGGVTAESALTETLAYNIQGWTTSQQARQGSQVIFDTQLRYFDPVQAGSTSSYTGNISEWSWQHGSGSGVGGPADIQTYAFSYDKLSQLRDTQQFTDGVRTNLFTESGIQYDLNGNIQTLIRLSNNQMTNDFIYSYDGNMLVSLTDEGDEGVVASGSSAGSVYTYEYDSNGNMTYDGANDLDLTYNHLNLIGKVARDGVTLANYSYLADGTKLSATDADGNGLVYAGSLVYRKQNGELALESAPFSGGRFMATSGSVGSGSGGSGSSGAGNGFAVHYHMTDHLGSVRAVVDGATGQVTERNDYYPFGLRWQNPNQPITDNRYRYNAKEEQAFLDLPYTDYGARWRDAKYGIGWNRLDPLAGIRPEESLFAFTGDNPINRIDPDGRWDIKVHVYNNRAEHGYGVAVVTNRSGKEVMRFNVRAEGVRGRNRSISGSDTPLGVYDIPNGDTWRASTNRNRISYGPNDRLVMTPESGEIVESGRDAIRIHGGRQETYDAGTDIWSAVENLSLSKTEGCLRAYDSDMETLQTTTTELEERDSAESPGSVTVVDDLQKNTAPASSRNMVEVKTVYEVSENPFPQFFWKYK